MTMFFLDVPRTVLFHHKIDWFYLSGCIFSIFMLHLFALLFRIANYEKQKLRPYYGPLMAMIGILISAGL
uniref:Uncharacterized protein n=1 Tax=Panagrolaimus sp. JU765 TaxID=591449 RepID=A0AC34Q5E9_9BILA